MTPDNRWTGEPGRMRIDFACPGHSTSGRPHHPCTTEAAADRAAARRSKPAGYTWPLWHAPRRREAYTGPTWRRPDKAAIAGWTVEGLPVPQGFRAWLRTRLTALNEEGWRTMDPMDTQGTEATETTRMSGPDEAPWPDEDEPILPCSVCGGMDAHDPRCSLQHEDDQEMEP